MNTIKIVIAILLSKLIASVFDFAYNPFIDDFNLNYLVIDVGIYVAAFVTTLGSFAIVDKAQNKESDAAE